MHTEHLSPIRRIRNSLGLTVEVLAVRAGLASATVYRAERGIGTPEDATLEAIAAVLGVDVSQLHGADGIPPNGGRGKSDEPVTAAVQGSDGLAHSGG